MSVRYHLGRASTERAVAAHANNSTCADIHLTLAALHDQAIAEEVNQALAPMEIPERLMTCTDGRAAGSASATGRKPTFS